MHFQSGRSYLSPGTLREGLQDFTCHYERIPKIHLS